MIRLFALLLALTAAHAASAQTLRIGLREDPDILDPTLGSSYVGRIVYAAMCDKLFDIDANLNIVPQLATGYEWADPTHLILHLRSGVTFHDGEKFDADAVKYKLTRDLTIKGSMRAGEINAIQAINVRDPLTVELVLKAPSAALLAQLTDRAGIMIAPKAAEEAGDKFGLHPVCAGPFMFDSRIAQDRIVLKRFPDYWNKDAIHFDQVIYMPQPNGAVRLANLQAGALDLVEYISPTDVAAVRKDPKLKVSIGDALTYQGITINTGNSPASNTTIGQNALVRQAFELAIDRKAMIDVVYDGLFTPTVQANPPSSPYYFADMQPPARDVEKAKALLKQAGVPLPVPVTLMAPNNPDLQQIDEVIQSMAQEAGFDVKLQSLEFASSLQAGYRGDFNAYNIAWSGRIDPDGNLWPFLHTTGTFNYGHYDSKAMDDLLDQARLTPDQAARKAIYRKVVELERKDLPLIYLWTPKNVVGMRKAVTGFVQVPDGLIRLQNVTLAPG
ncbi:ABC transporter substrate-binding protein [Acidisphaera sp. L21]|uniref:ABC transporter substrate-binding protein n=1 Tax=Acidisphaera sp. L21 TaxID=1641851 RepID=UPI00131CD28C|nr:ABC transporter substrate-binding protein [Acidisphaera sp. L21]